MVIPPNMVTNRFRPILISKTTYLESTLFLTIYLSVLSVFPSIEVSPQIGNHKTYSSLNDHGPTFVETCHAMSRQVSLLPFGFNFKAQLHLFGKFPMLRHGDTVPDVLQAPARLPVERHRIRATDPPFLSVPRHSSCLPAPAHWSWNSWKRQRRGVTKWTKIVLCPGFVGEINRNCGLRSHLESFVSSRAAPNPYQTVQRERNLAKVVNTV